MIVLFVYILVFYIHKHPIYTQNMVFVKITQNGEDFYFRKANRQCQNLIKNKKKNTNYVFCKNNTIKTFENTENGISEMITYVVQNYHMYISVYTP